MKIRINCFVTSLTVLAGLFVLFFGQIERVYAHGEITTEAVKLDPSSFPPIDEDVHALSEFGQPAKLAGVRLIERGDEILGVAHGVLADANSSYPQRLQLLYVLGEIGNVTSATEIIHAIEDFPNNRYLYQNALLALSNFEPTEEINNFVNRQLETTKRDPLIQRSALNYYAKQPHEDANQWVEKYALNDRANSEVRYAALYMAGMNDVDVIKEPIKEVLDSTISSIREYYLLLGFANVATMEEFNALVKGRNLNLDNVKKVREFLKFRLASEQEKKSLSPDLLNSNNPQLKQAVVKHLINKKDADGLATNWQQGDGVVRAAVKRAGFTINKGVDGVSMDEVHDEHTLSQWQMILILLGLSAVVFVGWFVGLRGKY